MNITTTFEHKDSFDILAADPGMNGLEPDTWSHVRGYLPPKDLGSLSQVLNALGQTRIEPEKSRVECKSTARLWTVTPLALRHTMKLKMEH